MSVVSEVAAHPAPCPLQATRIAREYYDSTDADNFYYHVWGGEDLHIGWHERRGSSSDLIYSTHCGEIVGSPRTVS